MVIRQKSFGEHGVHLAKNRIESIVRNFGECVARWKISKNAVKVLLPLMLVLVLIFLFLPYNADAKRRKL